MRLATVADAPGLAALVGALLIEIMAAIDEPAFRVDPAATERRLREALAADRYRVLLAETVPGDLIGFVALLEGFALYTEGSFGLIPEFYVAPDHRGGGVGHQLLAAAVAHGRQRGWSRLEVTTPPLPAFKRTLAFYEREGFSVSGGLKLKLTL